MLHWPDATTNEGESLILLIGCRVFVYNGPVENRMSWLLKVSTMEHVAA